MSIGSIEAEGGWRARARWSLAAAVVLVAHLAGAWVLARQEPDASTGEAASAIMIELAPLPVAPAAEPVDLPPAPEVTPPPEPEPEPVEESPQPELDIPSPPEPAEPTFNAADLQPPPPPPVPEPEVVMPEPPKKPPEAEQPKPEVKKKPEVRKTARRVPRQDERAEKKPPKPRSKVATAPPRPQAAAAAPAAPSLSSAPSMSAAPANWRGMLLAHLNRAKRYPAEARQRREEGTVRLNFSIDRSGNVVGYRIAGSSGSAALDQEALAMIQRASPLPAPPPEVGGARITLTVPVRFNIN